MAATDLRLGVYVVTSSPTGDPAEHARIARAAWRGGADVVQVRGPRLHRPQLAELAVELAEEAGRHGARLIVNDDPQVAVRSGAHGLHVGQGDLARLGRVRELRAVLGPNRILGVSVDDPTQAGTAADEGADYLGVTVHGTATKPEARAHGLEGLRAITAATHLPVVAIGGLTPASTAEVLRAGAAGVAVVSWVGQAQDPEAATRELVAAVRAARS